MKDGIGFTIRCPGSHPGRVKKMTALFGARSRLVVLLNLSQPFARIAKLAKPHVEHVHQRQIQAAPLAVELVQVV